MDLTIKQRLAYLHIALSICALLAVLLFVINIVATLILSFYYGGGVSWVDEMPVDGKYFLHNHGELVEVSSAIYSTMRFLGISKLWIVAGGVSSFLLALPGLLTLRRP